MTLVERVGTTNTATYLYGLGRIARLDADNRVRFYHHDGLGSVRALTNTTNSYPSDVNALTPVASWRLGESSGTTANDETSNNLDGTLAGGVTLAQTGVLHDDSNTAAAFNGSSGLMTVAGNPAALQIATGSLSCWFKLPVGSNGTGTGWHLICGKASAYGLYILNGQLVTYNFSDGGIKQTQRFPADGNWHQVVLTFDGIDGASGGPTKVYYDGQLVLTATTEVANQTRDFAIGADAAGTEYLNGTVDEVSVFGTVLTAQQVSDLYAAGKTASGPGEVVRTYQYAAFGSTSLRGGTDAAGVANTYTYTGEDELSADGLLYLRARYYDPRVGRFITKDPFPGLDQYPQTLNPYSYAGNNPINVTDPSGKCIWDGCALEFVGVGLFLYGAGTFFAWWVSPAGEDFRHYAHATAMDLGTAIQNLPYEISIWYSGGQWIDWPEDLPKAGEFPYVPPAEKGARSGKVKRVAKVGQGGPFYEDEDGNLWGKDKSKRAVGKVEWDVQDKKGGHTNVGPNGNITH